MGKKARTKRERQGQVGERRNEGPGGRRLAIIITAIVVFVGAIIAIVIATTSGQGGLPKSTASGAVDPLLSAALAIDFHPTTEAGVGVVESMPASAATPPSAPDLLPVGSVAPDFTLSTPRGQEIRLSDYRGKSVLLEFFATWCPHCQAETPHLIRLFSELGRSRYAFLSVNADGEDAASVYAFELYFKIPFPELLDPSSRPGSFYQQGGAGKVTSEYHVGYYPTFYIINPAGVITWRSDKEQPDAFLIAELRRAART